MFSQEQISRSSCLHSTVRPRNNLHQIYQVAVKDILYTEFYLRRICYW
jgi:hypothetical protein